MPSDRTSAASALFTRDFARDFPVAVRGEGAWLWDDAGRRYLDLSGSAAVSFIGHGVRAIADAMAEQAARLEYVHSSQFVTREAEEFAGELLDFAGAGFRGGAVYFTCGGSEAVETALKLARQFQVESGHPARRQIISRRQGYHGSTLGALAVSGNAARRSIYLPMVREGPQIGLPYCYRCAYGCKDCARQYAAELERAIEESKGTGAAFIFEPMSGATLGAVAPPDGYLQQVAEISKRCGLLLIADEIMTGYGRTGRNFACEHCGVTPDILVVAKGLSSGYAPLGAVIAGPRVVEAIARGSGTFIHGFTYNAHPVAVAAGHAVLRHMKSQRLVARAQQLEAKMRGALGSLLDLPAVGDVRGRGLLWGIEFVADKASKRPFERQQNFAGRVAQAAAARGLMLYPMQGCVDGESGDHLLIAPPAVISDDETGWAAGQLRAAISSP